MLSISHFLQIWILPPGIFLILFILFFLFWQARHKPGKFFFVCTYTFFWLCCTPLFAQFLIDHLQKQYVPLSAKWIQAHETADTDAERSVFNSAKNPAKIAIIVLGSGVDSALEYPERYALSEVSLSRLHYAAYLYQKTHFPIVVSGGNRTHTTVTEAEAMQNTLQKAYHIPTFLIETKSRNTFEQSHLLLPLLQKNHIQTIVLVTNAWHMPRSILAFKANLKPSSVNIIPAPMGFISLSSASTFMNLLPTLSALNATSFAFHEYIGIVWYWLLSKR